MEKISLIVGETSSLPKEIIEKYRMVVVPYCVDWPEGNNLLGENIFQKMREAERKGINTLPKTSQPSPWIFKEIFEEELKKNDRIICLTLSSKLSGGYNSACQGRGMLSKKEQDKIFIVDSLNITAGEGLLTIRAAKLIESGRNIDEVIKELREFIPQIRLFGMLEDPKWSEAGGRVSHTLAVLLRQMQKIGMRPLIGLKNGEVKPVTLKMQAKDVPTALFKELVKETIGKNVRLAIAHADNLKGAQKLKDMVEEELPGIEIAFLSLVDNVIGVHVGPGGLLCSWHELK